MEEQLSWLFKGEVKASLGSREVEVCHDFRLPVPHGTDDVRHGLPGGWPPDRLISHQ